MIDMTPAQLLEAHFRVAAFKVTKCKRGRPGCPCGKTFATVHVRAHRCSCPYWKLYCESHREARIYAVNSL